MKHTKLALMIGIIAVTVGSAHTMTIVEIMKLRGASYYSLKTRARSQINTIEEVAKIVDISDESGEESVVWFTVPKNMKVDLTERRGAIMGLGGSRRHIRDEDFGDRYTDDYVNARISGRREITKENYIQIMAEIYFLLKEKGIASTGSYQSKNRTFRFILKADETFESFDPRNEKIKAAEAKAAMRVILNLVKKNKKSPEEGVVGEPLHESIGSSDARTLEDLYKKYKL